MVSLDEQNKSPKSPRWATTIEAILYLKAKPLKVAEIAEYATCDRAAAEDALIELMDDYAHRDSALEILETDEGYSLQLRENYKYLIQHLVPAEIGLGALRTLAVIALKGPIVQTDLIDLRGSGAYQHVHELVERGFVMKRRQSNSRSFRLQVTDQFYQYFEVDQLPKVRIPEGSIPTPPAEPDPDSDASGDTIDAPASVKPLEGSA